MTSASTKTVNNTPTVILGITGGVAAYKAAELTRALVKQNIAVQVVMTEAGREFITPVTLQALSGRRVFTDLWDASIDNNMAHIELSRHAQAILVAPATADFLAKLAHGLANDLLSTLCLARNAAACPLMVAPAMNREMWENPATQRNIAQLRADGVVILGPDAGEQACGETGLGRMLEPDALLDAVLVQLKTPAAPSSSSRLAGVRALITAGPTFEAIDPVRGITNGSSGKMGYAIAAALRDQGATVTLVSGPTALATPARVTRVDVTSAAQMRDAVQARVAECDLFFAVAAVADYTPAKPNAHKMKKATAELTLTLTPTVDILAEVAASANAPFCVGFAAESENVLGYARTKREKKRLPMIVANHANSAIGADDNEVTIIDDRGETPVPRGSKATVAAAIVAHAAELYAERTASSATASSANIRTINPSKNKHA
jgi:phosphopantothenoylcysteine decarboxylase / phosphopantothenate---cysteine ligase